MKKIITLIFLLLFSTLSAEDVINSSNNQIAFLTLYTNGDSVSLTKSIVVSGKLKKGHDLVASKGIFYEVITGDLTIDSGYVDNPLIKRFEYEDPQNPGQMAVKFVELEETEFLVRVRYNPEIEQIRFFMQPEANKSSRKSLGSISIPQLKEEQK